MKRNLRFTALFLGAWLGSILTVAGQQSEHTLKRESPDKLVRLLSSKNFHEREQATISLMQGQAAAVAPVLEVFLNSPQNLEIRTRCHRILMRLIESEPFTTSDPSERYGLSRRLLAIDPARFPDLTKHLAELRRLSVNPSTNTPSSNVNSALQAAGLRFEQTGNRTTIWVEDSWNQKAEALQAIRLVPGPVTVIFGYSYKYEYLKQMLSDNIQEFKFWSNQHTPADRIGNRKFTRIFERDTRLLGRFKQLRSLDIAYAPIQPEALRHLASLKQLQRLRIGGAFEDTDLKFLSQLTELVHLDIHQATETDGRFLKHIAPLKKLSSLNIETAKIDDEGLKTLTQLPNLTTLYAPRTIGDSGTSHLANIAPLKVLVLPESSVTKNGLNSLSQLKNLYHLTINMKRLNDDALQAIGELKGLTSLRLVDTQLTGDGLSWLSRLPKLKFISIESEVITASGLQILLNNDSLEKIEIRKHNLSKQDFEKFKALRPDVELLH